MSNPQDPYAPRSGDLPSTAPPPAGWQGAGGPMDPAAPARPGTVVAAVVFWVLGGLTLLFFGALTMAAAGTQEAKEAVARFFENSQLQVSDALIEQILVVTGVTALVVGLLIAVFGALLLGGSNWARITVTVLGVLGVLVIWFTALFTVPAIVLQFLPPSNAWFRSRVTARRT